MNNFKRVAILLAIFAVAIIVSIGYRGTDILNRSIVLGVGVDSAENGKVEVTVEIVSPGNGGEQVGMFSKTARATGDTVAEALQHVSVLTGKEVSLGQCVLLVYGEEFIQGDFSDTAEYFSRSNSFQESATVCCCKGRASDLLENVDAAQSVSLSIADKLKGTAKDAAIPSNDLLKFSRSQTELYKTGFLNYVECVMTENVNENGQKQSFFQCKRVAVFRQYNLVGILDEQETAGFALLNSKVTGNVFAVGTDNLVTLRTNSKKVDSKQKDGQVIFDVKLKVKLARTDTFGAGGSFTAQTEKDIPQQLLNQAQKQSEQWITAFLQKQREWDFDIVDVHELFRQKQGTTPQVVNLSMQNVPIVFSVTVTEK